MFTLGSAFYRHQPFMVRKQICGVVVVAVMSVVAGGVQEKKEAKVGLICYPA